MTLSERMPGDASDRPYVTIALLALFVFAGLMIVVAALTSGQAGAPGDQSAAGAPTVTNATEGPGAAEAPANETTETASATTRESTPTSEPVTEERSPTVTATASATPTAEPTTDSTTSGSSSGGNGAAPAPSDDTDEPTSTPTATDTATPTEAGTATETETATEAGTVTDTEMPTDTATETASPTPMATSTPPSEPTDTPPATATPTDTPATTATPTAEPAPTPSPASYQVTVDEVVEGDTMNVRYENGSTERVRLLGVDVPSADGENDPDNYEGVPDTEGARECLRAVGDEADQYAHDRLLSRTVEIRTDDAADRRDSQGRLLVYLNVEGDDFSTHMLEEGRARVVDMTFSRSGAYSDVESQAQEENNRVWGCSRYGTPTPDNSG